MARKEKQVETYWEAEMCECGGVFDTPKGDCAYPTYPIKKDFSCNNCGKIKRLSENEFPGVKHRIIKSCRGDTPAKDLLREIAECGAEGPDPGLCRTDYVLVQVDRELLDRIQEAMK